MTYLAIDYGRKRIGLAVGSIFPKGAGVIDGGLTKEEIAQKIEKVCAENEVSEIVIGLPLRSQGESGTLDAEIKDFAEFLTKKTGLKIHFETEEFTSSEAADYLRSTGTQFDRASGKVDELAAILILERFLAGKGIGE